MNSGNDAAIFAAQLHGFASEIEELAVKIQGLDRTPPPLAEIIGKLLATPLPLCPARLSPINVIDATAIVLNVPIGRILSKERTQRVAYARQVAMYLARQMTGQSFPKLGSIFGRDHSTVLHACKLISKRLKDPAIGAASIRMTADAVAALLNMKQASRTAEIEDARDRAA